MGLWLSFHDWDGVSDDRNWVGLENYRQIFTQDPVFWTAFQNSLIWVVLSLIVPDGHRPRAWPSPSTRSCVVATRSGRPSICPRSIASIAVATIWSWLYNPIFRAGQCAPQGARPRGAHPGLAGRTRTSRLYSIFVAFTWQSAGRGHGALPRRLCRACLTTSRKPPASTAPNSWNVFRAVTFPSLAAHVRGRDRTGPSSTRSRSSTSSSA